MMEDGRWCKVLGGRWWKMVQSAGICTELTSKKFLLSYACHADAFDTQNCTTKQTEIMHFSVYVRSETGGTGDLGLSADTALRSLCVLRSKSVNLRCAVFLGFFLCAAGGLGLAC